MGEKKGAAASDAALKTETKSVDTLVTDDAHKDEATAHLTLPAEPQYAGATATGEVTDEKRVKTAQDERAAALGEGEVAPIPDPPKTTDQGAVTDTRKVEVRTNEATGTQETVTVVADLPVQAPDAIQRQEQQQRDDARREEHHEAAD